MKIYTRRGDAGETDLFGGPRVHKDALLFDVRTLQDDDLEPIAVALADLLKR